MLFPVAPPSSPQRVVITGAGIVTAFGAGWSVNARGFRAGARAFRPVTLFDVSRQRAGMAGEVDLPEWPAGLPTGARRRRRWSRASRLLLAATTEAWRQAGWEAGAELPFVVGTTSGGMECGEEFFRRALAGGPARRRGQATLAARYQAQSQAGDVAEALGFGGPVTLVSNACASGADAIGHAWELVRSGAFPRVLTGGYDALSRLVFAGFDALQALSTTSCRPFDAGRDGLALGEGAATLALESWDHARARGAGILGEILGYGAALDIHHLAQPHPEGIAAVQAMNEACARAGVQPEDVDYVNAHGTGTPLNDAAEARAIARWAGARARTLPVSSTKGSIGHLLGGAGAVEAVVCLMVLREQWLPPEPHLGQVDPLCPFPIVREPTDARVKVVLSNSFGFGGANAALVLGRWP